MSTAERTAPRAGRRGGDPRGGSTFRRVLDAAAAELAVHGEAGFSLRSVARAAGVSVQSLYHYVDSRAALVDALAREAADALARAVDGAAGAATADELLAAAGAFRRWAGEHAAAFALLHGRGLPVGPCGCTGAAGRLRAALLGAPGGPGAEALVPFWAVVYALVASGCGPCCAAWETVVTDAAARAVRARG